MDYNQVPVKNLGHKGQSTLVEVESKDGMVKRVYVPSIAVSDVSGVTYVSEENLEMGIPYGLPFEELLSERYTIKREAIVRELHAAGIWTAQDVETNRGVVNGVILSVGRSIVAELNQIVRNSKRRI